MPSTGTRTALQAGRLLGEARMRATVDALILAEAISAAPCVILTSDPDDMTALVGDRTHVRIEPI